MANPTIFLATLDDTLAFTDTSGSGTLAAVAPVRYATLGSQNGIWVEEASSNLVTNPIFNAFTGWGNTGHLTRTLDATETKDGYSSMRLEANNDPPAASWYSGPNSPVGSVAEGNVVTARIYSRASVSGVTPRLNIIWKNSGGTTLSTSTGSFTEVTTVSGEWTKLQVSGTAPANTSLIAIGGDIASGTWAYERVVWYVMPQAEINGYATSFITGGIGDGYAWSGTENLSISTRAASSVSVDQDGTARIDPASGSLAFRYKRLIDTGAEEVILTSGVVGSGTDYLEIGIDTSDDLYMEWNSNNAGAQRVTIATTVAVDTDYFFYFDWDGTAIRASIDNGSLSSDTRAAAEGDWSTGDLTLSAAVGSHVVGPLLVADRPLTTKEIARLNARSTWGFSTLKDGNRYNIFQLRPRAA